MADGDKKLARTFGELKASGYRSRNLKEEMRENLIRKMENDEPLFPGIIGYERSVIPAIENAILSGHDMVFLGERGQAKTRLIRALVGFLDPQVPVVAGCEINDDPFRPICKECKDKLLTQGDEVEIEWMEADSRYGEKLATPDVSIADLIGEIDPVKIAEGRYLSDETAIHFGLIPRTNRGIFAINELPDLAEKVQVGLFNIMEERDVQIKGFKVRLPIDTVVVASANPEDYTHRGRIITPLKDRFSSQIRTHYPEKRSHEAEIMEQERHRYADEESWLYVPDFIREVVVEITFEARACPEINQRSGVSVRMSIANYESVISNARKRCIRLKEKRVVPRVSDLFAVFASSRGKIELEYSGEDRDETEVVDLLLQRAIKSVFDKRLQIEKLKAVIDVFNAGGAMEVSDEMASTDYMDAYSEIPELGQAAKKLDDSTEPEVLASAAEFILEGLHLNNMLNKTQLEGKRVYRAARQAV